MTSIGVGLSSASELSMTAVPPVRSASSRGRGVTLGGPAGACESGPALGDVDVGDADDVESGEFDGLGQEHRRELAGADDADPDRARLLCAAGAAKRGSWSGGSLPGEMGCLTSSDRWSDLLSNHYDVDHWICQAGRPSHPIRR